MTMISTLYSLPRIAGRRIGLFGGSFNPAHAGHLAVSEEALKRLQLDEVWWLVSPQNPLKDSADTADFERRVAHARKLAAHPRMRVSDLEARLGTRTTAQTFAALRPMFDLGNLSGSWGQTALPACTSGMIGAKSRRHFRWPYLHAPAGRSRRSARRQLISCNVIASTPADAAALAICRPRPGFSEHAVAP
jgi:hypothetical protein